MVAGVDVAAPGCDGATGQAPPGIAIPGLAMQRDVACYARIQRAPHLCTHTQVSSSSSSPCDAHQGFEVLSRHLQKQLHMPHSMASCSPAEYSAKGIQDGSVGWGIHSTRVCSPRARWSPTGPCGVPMWHQVDHSVRGSDAHWQSRVAQQGLAEALSSNHLGRCLSSLEYKGNCLCTTDLAKKLPAHMPAKRSMVLLNGVVQTLPETWLSDHMRPHVPSTLR